VYTRCIDVAKQLTTNLHILVSKVGTFVPPPRCLGRTKVAPTPCLLMESFCPGSPVLVQHSAVIRGLTNWSCSQPMSASQCLFSEIAGGHPMV